VAVDGLLVPTPWSPPYRDELARLVRTIASPALEGLAVAA
jgi:hypothetical protein